MELDIYHYTNLGGSREKHDVAALTWDGCQGLFSLADGLGGAQDNGLASKLVVDAITADWTNTAESRELPLVDWFPVEFLMLNELLLARKQREPVYQHMKASLVSLAITPSQVAWAHIGDTRLYYIHQGHLQSVTADHTVAFKKHLAGELTKNQLNTDEDRFTLLGALGDGQRCKPSSAALPHPLCPGDGFFLCSDGFWRYICDTELLIEQCGAQSAQQWVEALLLRILPRIAPSCDNLSAIAILVK